MPLEVRELIIRALVDPSKSTQGGNSNSGAASSSSSGGSSTESWEFQKALLDQFHEMLKKKKER